MGAVCSLVVAWLRGDPALTIACLRKWVRQPTSRQRINNLSCSRNFLSPFKGTPPGLIFFFFFALFCRLASFLEAFFFSNSKPFLSVNHGTCRAMMSKGACFVLFSCLDCSSAPRSGSSSCQLPKQAWETSISQVPLSPFPPWDGTQV